LFGGDYSVLLGQNVETVYFCIAAEFTSHQYIALIMGTEQQLLGQVPEGDFGKHTRPAPAFQADIIGKKFSIIHGIV